MRYTEIQMFYSYKQESFYVSLCDWPRRVRQSVESWKEKGEEAICNEGDAQRPYNIEAKCEFGNEWEKISYTAESSVSFFDFWKYMYSNIFF